MCSSSRSPQSRSQVWVREGVNSTGSTGVYVAKHHHNVLGRTMCTRTHQSNVVSTAPRTRDEGPAAVRLFVWVRSITSPQQMEVAIGLHPSLHISPSMPLHLRSVSCSCCVSSTHTSSSVLLLTFQIRIFNNLRLLPYLSLQEQGP